MDFLNQNLNIFSTQISDTGIIDRIFEANLINLTLLDGGLFYLLSGTLSESLLQRREEIVTRLEESENKLQESITILTQAETKLAQAETLTEKMQFEATKTAKRVVELIYANGSKDAVMLKKNQRSEIFALQSKVCKELYEEVVKQAIEEVECQYRVIPYDDDGYLNKGLDKDYLRKQEEILACILPVKS